MHDLTREIFIGENIAPRNLLLISQVAQIDAHDRMHRDIVQKVAIIPEGMLHHQVVIISHPLLLDGQLLCYQVRCDYLTAVAAGRGVSFIFFPERLRAPLKSKYVLLSPAGYSTVSARLGPALHLQPLRATPVGELYLNLDCACR